MEKTRDPIQKIGNTKGLFHARTGVIKGRDSKALTEADEVQVGRQEHSEQPHTSGTQMATRVWARAESQASPGAESETAAAQRKALVTQMATRVWARTETQASRCAESAGP